MYRVIKVLNNNGILVYHVETGKEMILLGNGVGFGKKPTEQIEKLPGAKVYSLVTRRKQESVLKTVNGIRLKPNIPLTTMAIQVLPVSNRLKRMPLNWK